MRFDDDEYAAGLKRERSYASWKSVGFRVGFPSERRRGYWQPRDRGGSGSSDPISTPGAGGGSFFPVRATEKSPGDPHPPRTAEFLRTGCPGGLYLFWGGTQQPYRAGFLRSNVPCGSKKPTGKSAAESVATETASSKDKKHPKSRDFTLSKECKPRDLY